jgi:tRNA dimethylallyltransferase
LATGLYTKRQATWFRHKRMADPARTHMIDARISNFSQFSESEQAEIFRFIRGPA